MNLKQRRRFVWIGSMVVGVGIAVALVLFALNKNINLYYTPSQLSTILPTHDLRIGGLVQTGSLKRDSHSLKMQFVITDYKKKVNILYTGVVPSLFREGQGVVVEGQFRPDGIFVATQVLAKHDEKYMPPGINQGVKHAS